MNQYFQTEIQKSGDLAPLLKGMLDTQQKILDRLDAVEARGNDMDDKLTNLVAAFPNNDMEGHRRYHATMMEILEEKRRLRMAVMEKTISGLVWGFLCFAAYSFWEYVRGKMHGQ